MLVLVMHSEDDQIVPYVAIGPLSAKLWKNGTLKTHKDFPHGISRLPLENGMSIVGFGLGDMGSRMVPHLLGANHQIVVFDVIRDRLDAMTRAWGCRRGQRGRRRT